MALLHVRATGTMWGFAEAGVIILFMMPIMGHFPDGPVFWFALGPALIPLHAQRHAAHNLAGAAATCQ